MGPWMQRLMAWRFARFGTVGALGTVVNLAVLWAAQEWLLKGIAPEGLRLSLSLALSIAVSTVHNFAWNRAWTWADRRPTDDTPLLQQLGQYALACWFGILLQFILTRALADAMHYMLAATLAIVLASVANYAINDLWTFGRRLLVAPSSRLLLAMQLALVALTAWAYGTGLDGQNIPKNGDELVYAHITRLTAATGQWLPLASGLDNMRNTKPPFVFWQGLASTGFAEHWSLWRLRWPSVAWTLATALLIGVVAARLGHRMGSASMRVSTLPASRFRAATEAGGGQPGSFDLPTGLVAALVWLGFFTTFRYGRPYLTNPPEVFWLSLPMLALLWAAPRGFDSRWAWPLGLGLAVGLGLFAKSFALLAPVGAVLALWWWQQRRWRLGTFLRRDTLRLLTIAVVSLGVFSLWFALDPDPRAIWQEFVVGENLGKMDNRGNPALTFFTGPDSFWEYALAGLSNAGLLAGVVVALGVVAWRERRSLSLDERRLWIWLAVFVVVFALPSQRSARYLLPAMPALALLVALRWRELPPWGARVGHGLGLVVVLLLAWLALGLQEGSAAAASAFEGAGGEIVRPMAWAVFLLAATVALAGLAVSALTRTALLGTVALVHLSIGVFLMPFDGPAGRFPVPVQQAVAGQTVWVPCNFRARFEGHGFLLPGAQPRGWDERVSVSLDDLAARYPLFAWRQPLAAPPPACEGCEVLAQRLDLRSRHRSAEIRAMLGGDAAAQLFTREWLVRAAPRPSHDAHRDDAQCR